MTNKDTISKIIRHPLIRKIMENKMATSSVITKLIAEEISKQFVIQEFNESDSKQLVAISNLKDLLAFMNKREEADEDLEVFIDKMSNVDSAIDYINEKFSKVFKGNDNYLQGIEPIEGFKHDEEFMFRLSDAGLPHARDYILWKFVPMAAEAIKGQSQTDLHECLKLLGQLIKAITNELEIKKEDLAKISKYFIQIITGEAEINDKTSELFDKIKPTLEKLDESIQKFAQAVENDENCKKQFEALKSKDPEAYIIGKFLISWKYLINKLEKTEDKEDCVELLKNLIEMFTSKYKLDEKAFAELTVKIFEVYVSDKEFENDEEKKNILEKFNSTLKPFIEKHSEKIDKFVKMYEEQIEECKEKVDALEDSDIFKYKIAMFFVNYRNILDKMGTTSSDSETPPEIIELAKDAIENYVANFDLFCQKFLNVKTLHQQSELFRMFYATIFPIAGINPDTIVGDQISSYTATAQPDQRITDADTNIKEADGDQQGQRKLTKDIAQNAKTIERHANAILEVLEGYEKYLNISDDKGKLARTGGVEQGSRELFNKFGESDPKKLINKFVKLIVKDINAEIKIIDEMIAQAEQALQSNEQPQQASAKRDDVLTEAAVDNSVRDLPVRDKIILVIKTGKKVCEIGARLKDMIAKETKSQEKKPAEQPQQQQQQPQQQSQQQQQQQQQQPGKRDDLKEAETMASDARINPDPTGTDSDPRDLRNMGARQGDEIHIGYKELAKQIHELMTKIRPLFPTSQPFDTNYDFSVAIQAFKAALKGLSSHVAQVSGFEFDQVTSSNVLESFKNKLEAFKKVIIDIFGYSEELKDSKNQASFNQEGQKSGMPHAGGDKEKEEPEAKTADELLKNLQKVIKDYENLHYLTRMIMTVGYTNQDANDNSQPFIPIQNSQAGKITTNINSIKSANKTEANSLAIEEKKIEQQIQDASKGDFTSGLEKLKTELITWLKRIINSGDFNQVPLIREKEENENLGQKQRIKEVGQSMIEILSSYYLMKKVMENLEDNTDIGEQEIKEMNDIIKEFKNQARLIVTRVNRFPIKKQFDNNSEEFYSNFHEYKIPGFIPGGKKNTQEPSGNTKKSDSSKKKNPGPPSEPEDNFVSNTPSPKRSSKTQNRQRYARSRQSQRNENKLTNLLKPLIREMLKKGNKK